MRAVFDALTAFYTGDFTGFNNSLPVGIAVGAEDYRAFLIF